MQPICLQDVTYAYLWVCSIDQMLADLLYCIVCCGTALITNTMLYFIYRITFPRNWRISALLPRYNKSLGRTQIVYPLYIRFNDLLTN
jgi:hypothetical protein